MNLSFMTHYPERMGELAGQPTHFVESIYTGLFAYDLADITLWNYIDEYYTLALNSGLQIKSIQDVNSKITTIRYDPHDRWKVGSKIHFIINPRTPNRFQFAPILGVKSVQKIDIYPNANVNCLYEGETENFKGMVLVDNIMLSRHEVEKLAINDGFNSVDDFFKWFNEDFSGKIIHWTNFKY